MQKQNTWLITRHQIMTGDIEAAIRPVDPEQISDREIATLHGAVRLRIEDVKSVTDISLNAKHRSFFQAMHSKWPWAGYFLRLCPVTLDSGLDEIIDLSVFIGLALCHVKPITCRETTQAAELSFDLPQLSRHFAELHSRAAQLGQAAGIAPEEIARRNAVILGSITSFFKVGIEIHGKNINRNKNQ
jgi:hypothetical protein